MLKRSILVTALFCAVAAWAQQAETGGSLSGRLNDPSGADVAGATVTLVQHGTERSRSTVSDRNGRFEFVGLPDGQYDVTVERTGFAGERRVVRLQAHEAEVVSVQMEKVGVSAQLPGQRLSFDAPRAEATAPQSLTSAGGGERVAEMPDMLDGLAAIQEFRVVSDAYRAGMGGYIGAQSMTGMAHGEIYGLAGSSLIGLNRVPVLAPLTQYGGSAGGAIERDRTSYFVGFDQNSMDRRKLLGGNVGQPLLQKDSAGHSLVSSQLLARIDHRFGGNDTMTARYSRSAMSGNSLKSEGVPSPGLNLQQQTAAVDNTISISPKTGNETHAQFIDGNVQVPVGAPASGVQADVATMRRYRIYEAADNLYRQMGRQNLRMGGDFFFNQMSVTFLERASGNSSFSQSSRNAGFYAQDQWKMRRDFVVTAGARYDLESLRGVHTDTNNFAPQIGFAWAPGGSRSPVIRGGFGLMYEQLPLPTISGAQDVNGAVNLTRSGNFTVGRDSSPIGSLASFSTVDPMIQNAYAEQSNLEVEQQVGKRTTVSASFQHVSGHAVQSTEYSTAALCAVASGCDAGNEFYSGLRYASGSSSSYNDLSVALVQRPARWGDYKISYTYATAQSSGGQMFNELVGDRMRRVAFTGALHTSPDTATNLWQLLSHNFALSGYGDFTQRNELPGLDFIHLNTQLVKSFQLGTHTRLEAVAQTFNMLEHRHYSLDKAREELGDYGVNILSSYERVAALGTPNGSQVGLRLKF
ncbi:MAG TPA: TonB-dependent receptor [Edaphobacter sp.]